ncbi:MAG TPA: hypothetical protein VE076_05850 [Nitrososphaeraceae archaeon]|jgi:hypothetical protein|nr:hypothetical protein [Nitrososphaeraceae archaeon]
MTTPMAIVRRAVTRKIGLIINLRGSGAVEENSHFSPVLWHSLRTGNRSKTITNMIKSPIPIDEKIAPDFTTICGSK